MPVYTLWDIETNNLVAEHHDLGEASAFVRAGREQHGPHDTDTLSLEVLDVQGDSAVVAWGADLATLAQRDLAEPVTLNPDRLAG